MLSSFLSIYIATTLNSDNSFLHETSKGGFSLLTSTYGITKQEKIPVKDPYLISPVINAGSVISKDISSGMILYEKNMHKRMPMASITKLMTILIILEENEFDEIAKISNNANATEGSTMFLRTGEEITIENLLYGAIINSANDAAVALAEHNAGSVEDFVKKMNRRAQELQLFDTNFSNPIGLDEESNYSSAHDIAKLADYLYRNKFVKKSAKIKTLDVKSVSGKLTHNLESTNELLDSYLKINGLKTGKTDAAGLCLVAIAENDNGNEIVTVVLDSPARFEESKILIDWTFRAYKWSYGKSIAHHGL